MSSRRTRIVNPFQRKSCKYTPGSIIQIPSGYLWNKNYIRTIAVIFQNIFADHQRSNPKCWPFSYSCCLLDNLIVFLFCLWLKYFSTLALILCFRFIITRFNEIVQLIWVVSNEKIVSQVLIWFLKLYLVDAYSYLPNKRVYTPHLVLVQLPPYTILFGPARLLIFELFSSLPEIKF